MKAFETRGNDGKHVGLLFNPETGQVVTQDNLIDLMRFVKYVSTKHNVSTELLDSMKIENDKFIFLRESDNSTELNLILNACDIKLTESIIVPQAMGYGPSIRHRPLHFGLVDDGKSIEVKFTEFGDFNSFNVAMEQLRYTYPEAVKCEESDQAV